MSILGQIGNRSTPQSEPVPGKDMLANNAGGFAFGLDDWARLSRFLVLGVDAGTYYVKARPLALDNAAVVRRCLEADPARTVNTAIEVSTAGRAPSNDPAIFVLAVAAAHPKASGYALAHLRDVCRTGTHLFHFAQYVEGFRGWGRGLRRAVANWYERGDVDALAYQAVKYRQRDGWTHRDLLRLSHPEAPSAAHKALYDFICGREATDVPRIVEGYQRMTGATTSGEVAGLIQRYGLPWETVPSDLRDAAVWNALLDSGSLPLGATVRNLGVMTARGALAPGSTSTRNVVARLGRLEAIRKARLHPVALLNALVTYSQGHSRGGVEWNPVPAVVDALDGAFYNSFNTVEPADKRTLLALDVSGSMHCSPVTGAAFTAAQGSAAMAMVTAATEPETIAVAFSRDGADYCRPAIAPVDISPRRRLDDQMRALSGIAWGGTDCAQPMLWALSNNVEVDTFVIYTDNETWAGRVHPFQALRQYRERTGIDARLIVVGMTSTGFSIADPGDPGMLDVVGFDTTTPSVLSEFSAGRA